jgi:hypothetical protein
MRSFAIVFGLLLMAVALRTARRAWVRKIGALVFLIASFATFYLISGRIWIGLIGVILWFFLPWVELLTRVKRMKLPMENRLLHGVMPNASFFPNAQLAYETMEEQGFTHASDCSWNWSGMKQHYRLYYHLESRTIAALCLCEQADVAFSFISVSVVGEDGSIWRTTNYPFAPTLKYPEHVHWNHVPCTRSCFKQIWENHRDYLSKSSLPVQSLAEFDPYHLDEMLEGEMDEMIAYNLDQGIIEFAGEGHFGYSTRGLFYLWGQFIKDMVRLC